MKSLQWWEIGVYALLALLFIDTVLRIWKGRATEGKECDHMFYPEYMQYGQVYSRPVGQRCMLCGKFNSIAEVEQQLNRRK